jgi:hypothetical protein
LPGVTDTGTTFEGPPQSGPPRFCCSVRALVGHACLAGGPPCALKSPIDVALSQICEDGASSPNKYLFISISENSLSGSMASQRIQSGLKFDFRYPARLMFGRVLTGVFLEPRIRRSRDCRSRRTIQLRSQSDRCLSTGRRLCRADAQGGKGGRFASGAANQVRASDQSQVRACTRPPLLSGYPSGSASNSSSRIEAALVVASQARGFDQSGKESECMDAIQRAKRLGG